jgi:hypothetical protein
MFGLRVKADRLENVFVAGQIKNQHYAKPARSGVIDMTDNQSYGLLLSAIKHLKSNTHPGRLHALPWPSRGNTGGLPKSAKKAVIKSTTSTSQAYGLTATGKLRTSCLGVSQFNYDG